MVDIGLGTKQMQYAQIVERVGKARKMSAKDILTAHTVALTESGYQNYANSNVPESLAIPHDAVGSDHMSVGIFQQQVGIWGTAAQLMDVTTSANKFFDALAAVPNRANMSVPAAAQTVQRSAFADGSNYAKELERGTQLTRAMGNSTGGADRVTGDTTDLNKGGVTSGSSGGGSPIKWLSDSGNWARIGLMVLGIILLYIAIWKLLYKIPVVGDTIDIGVKAAKVAVLKKV